MLQNNPEPEENFPSLRISIALIWLGYLASAMIISLLTKEIESIHLMIGEALFVAPLFIYLVRKKYDLKQVFRLKMVSPRILLASLAMALFVPVLLDEVDRIMGGFVNIPDEYVELIAKLFVAKNFMDWVYLISGTVILASILEEMIFRGMLLQSFEKKVDTGTAIFLSALLFAIVHLSIWLLQVMLVGCLFGYLSWRSRSILPGIILHSVNNLYSLIFTNFELNVGWYNWYSHVHPTAIAIAACITFYAIKWFNSLTPLPQKQNQTS